ncbi:MAG: hypothetical protein ACPGN3_11005 [Opitutales bacterium]
MPRIYTAQRSYTSSPSSADEWATLIGGITAEFERPPDLFFTLNALQKTLLFRSQDIQQFSEHIEADSSSITRIRIEISDKPAPEESPLIRKYVRIDATSTQDKNHSRNLRIYSRGVSKSALFRIEKGVMENNGSSRKRPNVTYGRPCEVMATMIDLQGFSAFCERPEIESPYTCAVVGAFYQTTEHCFETFPPDVLKIQGDGILMIWRSDAENRDLIAEVIRQGINRLDERWKALIKDPQFHHGAPSEIRTGVSFGLASSLTDQTDFLGRPINMASRISDQCDGNEILLDSALPGINEQPEAIQKSITLKGVGKRIVWSLPIGSSREETKNSKGGTKSSRLQLSELLSLKSKMAPR